MGDGLTVETRNGPAFTACLTQIRNDLAEPRGPLAAAGGELVTAAAGAAPRRSGRLAGSHRLADPSAKTIRVVADKPYAAPVHWGWPAHGIRRQMWLVATWLRDPRPMEKAADAAQAAIDKAAAKT